MNTPLSVLVENNINLDSKGGEWLLLMLEEKQYNPDKHISPLNFYKSLFPEGEATEAGYRNMMNACKRECDKTGMTVAKFVNSVEF